MDSGSISYIIVLIILISMSAYFSATETAFSSFNRIRMKNLAGGGDKRAQRVLEISENYDRLLSSILIGNNIVNISSASLATVIFVEYFGDAGVTISTVVMTILVLIFGEISPKSLAKETPEAFAMLSAPVLHVCITILSPLNYLFMVWKKLLSRMFKVTAERGITEEELITIVEEAQQDGGIDAQEGELIRSAIEFNDLKTVDILTPRIDIEAVPETADYNEIHLLFKETGYSRLPVYRGNIDHIVGVINQKDFHNQTHSGNDTVSAMIKPVIFAMPSAKISRLLKELQQSKSHMAIITDEYGGTMGLVTLEDIVEELVGEIWDEHDEIVKDIEQINENEYKIDCSANLDKFCRMFSMKGEPDVTTVSGWVTKQMGEIPSEGDYFTFDNLLVTVLRMEQRRVVEILVKVLEKENIA